MIKKEIEKILQKALFDAGYKKIPMPRFIIESPQNAKFGDYATNCIFLANELRKNPLKISGGS